MIYKTSEIDYTIDQDKTLEEINNVSNEDMIKNNLIRYSYIAKEKYNVDTNDRINEAVERLNGKSNDEINDYLKNAIEKKKHSKTKQLGIASTMSLGLILTVIGYIICMIAIVLINI